MYMADQESAAATLMEHANREVGITGELVSAVPEHSSAGKSKSTGRAERAVQESEDTLRCIKLALGERLDAKVTSTTRLGNGCASTLQLHSITFMLMTADKLLTNVHIVILSQGTCLSSAGRYFIMSSGT